MAVSNQTGWRISVLLLALLGACRPAPINISPANQPSAPLKPVILEADGNTESFSTAALTISDFLQEHNISIGPDDQVNPPLQTIIPEVYTDNLPLLISITRVFESTEVIPESIPFDRKIVRSADLSPEESPRLLQIGKPGYQEVTVRIVYHNGLEVERWPVSVDIIEAPQDEIVMISAPSTDIDAQITGILAYVQDGRPLVFGSSAGVFFELPINGQLDGRVFQLSPDGQYLLYTMSKQSEGRVEGFRNELWVSEVKPSSTGQSLRIENVLWAGWDPAEVDSPRIAYTTARTTTVPPGWEATNDLWLLDIATSNLDQPAPIRLIESYATPYGWWGGHYAWSPTANTLAYAYATEIGLISIPSRIELEANQSLSNEIPITRSVLNPFPEFNTGGDWAWVPALSWASNGRRLAFSEHAPGDVSTSPIFNLAQIDIQSREKSIIAEGVGIWSLSQWSPSTTQGELIAFLRADDPENSLESEYTLWIRDIVDSTDSQAYPERGKGGYFGRSPASLIWGPDETEIAFIFEDVLNLLNLDNGEVSQSASDDTIVGGISWAPYGAARDLP